MEGNVLKDSIAVYMNRKLPTKDNNFDTNSIIESCEDRDKLCGNKIL